MDVAKYQPKYNSKPSLQYYIRAWNHKLSQEEERWWPGRAIRPQFGPDGAAAIVQFRKARAEQQLVDVKPGECPLPGLV